MAHGQQNGQQRNNKNNRGNGEGRKSFREVRDLINSSSYFSTPNNFKEDGVDHANISITSSQELWKVLAPEYAKVINYPHIGKFNSVMSLWYWVRSSNFDDNVRSRTGRALLKYIQNSDQFGEFVPCFKSIMGWATWLKVKKYPHLLEQLRNFDENKKLLSYRKVASSDVRIATPYAGMMIGIVEEIIKAVKAGRDPNFDSFITERDEAMKGLNYLEGVLTRMMGADKVEEIKINAARAAMAGETHPDEDHDLEFVVEDEEVQVGLTQASGESTGNNDSGSVEDSKSGPVVEALVDAQVKEEAETIAHSQSPVETHAHHHHDHHGHHEHAQV